MYIYMYPTGGITLIIKIRNQLPGELCRDKVRNSMAIYMDLLTLTLVDSLFFPTRSLSTIKKLGELECGCEIMQFWYTCIYIHWSFTGKMNQPGQIVPKHLKYSPQIIFKGPKTVVTTKERK